MCLDVDEVPEGYSFRRFLDVMTATHIRRIRDPADASFPLLAWWNRSIPAWRWAHAHFLLGCRSLAEFGGADEPTHLAYDLLRHRAKNLIPRSGFEAHIDAILLYERNGPDRWLLESHLLLPELPANLAQKLGIDPASLEYYALWFFDVRDRLSKSSWIYATAMGPPGFDGFADDDLAPVWKRIAYTRGERALDIAVALTARVVDLSKYSIDECEEIELAIEELRLSLVRHPKRILQIERRLKAERAGEHPARYHMGRGLPESSNPVPSTAGERLDPLARLSLVEGFGETSLV